MIIKKSQIYQKIFLLQFNTQFDLTSTFLRFQEHYESPKFRGKIFTLKEYKKWYSSIKGGKFTYYKDWNGFNIPSYVLKPFYKGKFNPLSNKEKIILKLFKNEKHPFYIIAIHTKGSFKLTHLNKLLLKHEIAHALFYTNTQYKKQALNIIKKYKLSGLRKELLSLGGYHPSVINDEINSHSLDTTKKIKWHIPDKLKQELNILYLHYLNNIK